MMHTYTLREMAESWQRDERQMRELWEAEAFVLHRSRCTSTDLPDASAPRTRISMGGGGVAITADRNECERSEYDKSFLPNEEVQSIDIVRCCINIA